MLSYKVSFSYVITRILYITKTKWEDINLKRSSFLLALLIAMLSLVSCKCSCKHQYQEWVVTTEATCEETGVMTRTCKKCNKVEEQTIVALGHDYGNLISGITPTCEQTGEIAHYQCSRCNKYFDEQKMK